MRLNIKRHLMVLELGQRDMRLRNWLAAKKLFELSRGEPQDADTEGPRGRRHVASTSITRFLLSLYDAVSLG
jgi:hypothetical protein